MSNVTSTTIYAYDDEAMINVQYNILSIFNLNSPNYIMVMEDSMERIFTILTRPIWTYVRPEAATGGKSRKSR